MPRGLENCAEQKLRMLDKTPLGSSMASLRKCSSTLPAVATPLAERRNIILQRKKRTPAGRMKKFLKDRIQILNWIGDYNMEWGISDFIAGVTLGLTIIPESIACALLAGLPARYGLCSAFIGSFIYLIFGSINKVIIGPTSLVALVSVQFTVGKPIEFAFLLTFFSGCVQLLMGALQMGFIFDFISMPAIKAFSSATAILVIESQLKVLLGIKYVAANMLQSLAKLSENINDFNAGDLIMGLSAITFLILFEQLKRLSTHPKLSKPLRVIARYSSFARNTLIVLITAIVSIVWLQNSETVPYALSKNAHTGLPNVTVPEFSIVTPERTYSFWDIVKELNLGIIVIPIIGLLTNISIGKLEPKGLVDTNQELLTVGLCNVFGACVQSMPTSGAFSRYAISTACNLKTPMANLYSGVIALLALSFLSPYFKYIPEATLAAILICSIYTLLDFRLPLKMWRQSKRDFGTWIFCFIVCILRGVEVGLFFSIIINALHLLYLWARPEITVKIEECDEIQYISITPGNGIYFPAISHLRETVAKACHQADYSVPVVINCNKVTGIDFTAAQGFSKISADLCRHSDGDASSATLLILYRMDVNCQKLIALSDNLVFCEDSEKLREFLKQESLRNGFTKVKEHVRASIDLGYKIESA